jgi:hypothetical protein
MRDRSRGLELRRERDLGRHAKLEFALIDRVFER